MARVLQEEDQFNPHLSSIPTSRHDVLKRLLLLLAGATLMVCVVGYGQKADGFAQKADQVEILPVSDPLEAAYRSNLERCANIANVGKQPRAVCLAHAEGAYRIALAEEQIALARAEYAIARQTCATLSDGEKSACIKEAKAVRRIAKTNARASIRAAQRSAPVTAVASGKR